MIWNLRIWLSASILAGGFLLVSKPVFAHDDIAFPDHHLPLSTTYTIGLILSLFGAAALVGVYFLRRSREIKTISEVRYLEAVGFGYALWLFVGYAQPLVPDNRWLLNVGYVVLPLALGLTWLFVLGNLRHVINLVMRHRRYLALAVTVTLLYGAFYSYSTNLVAPPDPEDMPGAGANSFFVLYQSYGPLAIWPNVEFWISGLKLFGAISVGTALIAGTVILLVGMNAAIFLFIFRRRQQCYRQGALIGGSTLAALGTNFCCCCTPFVFPLLALIFGAAGASSLGLLLIGSTSPFYNLFQVGTLVLLIFAASMMAKRIEPIPVR